MCSNWAAMLSKAHPTRQAKVCCAATVAKAIKLRASRYSTSPWPRTSPLSSREKHSADYGKRFASLSSEPDGSDATWRTLTTLLNYRVFLNADFSPARFEFMSQRRGPQQTAELEADVIKRTVHFTYPNTIAPGNQTFVYLCALPERAWFFDGFQLRNVIFDGVGIEYTGGPIRLEDVYFV